MIKPTKNLLWVDLIIVKTHSSRCLQVASAFDNLKLLRVQVGVHKWHDPNQFDLIQSRNFRFESNSDEELNPIGSVQVKLNPIRLDPIQNKFKSSRIICSSLIWVISSQLGQFKIQSDWFKLVFTHP